jgi:hypothetical protein
MKVNVSRTVVSGKIHEKVAADGLLLIILPDSENSVSFHKIIGIFHTSFCCLSIDGAISTRNLLGLEGQFPPIDLVVIQFVLDGYLSPPQLRNSRGLGGDSFAQELLFCII